jgi:hypothetical protein
LARGSARAERQQVHVVVRSTGNQERNVLLAGHASEISSQRLRIGIELARRLVLKTQCNRFEVKACGMVTG